MISKAKAKALAAVAAMTEAEKDEIANGVLRLTQALADGVAPRRERVEPTPAEQAALLRRDGYLP